MFEWYLGIGIVCIVLGGLLTWREPRRIGNGFILETGLLVVLVGVQRHLVVVDQAAYTALAVIDVAYNLFMGLMGVALVADCIMVVRREGLTVAHVLPLVFGLGALAVSALGFCDMFMLLSGSELFVRIVSGLECVVLYVPFAIGGILLYAVVYALIPKPHDVDFIVVLGCGLMPDGGVTPLLRARLDKAIEWYRDGGGRARFVTSGGQGPDETVSEASAMTRYLVEKGIPATSILTEQASTSTQENLLFSRDVIERAGGGSMIICSSNYHVLRAAILARKLGIDAQGIGARTAPFYLPVAFLRECLAVIFQYKILLPAYIVGILAISWFQ